MCFGVCVISNGKGQIRGARDARQVALPERVGHEPVLEVLVALRERRRLIRNGAALDHAHSRRNAFAGRVRFEIPVRGGDDLPDAVQVGLAVRCTRAVVAGRGLGAGGRGGAAPRCACATPAVIAIASKTRPAPPMAAIGFFILDPREFTSVVRIIHLQTSVAWAEWRLISQRCSHPGSAPTVRYSAQSRSYAYALQDFSTAGRCRGARHRHGHRPRPVRRPRPEHDRRCREGRVWRGAARRDRRGRQPGPHRKDARGGDQRRGPLRHRRHPPRHLHGDVHADRVQHVQARRRRRPDQRVGPDQRRDEGRRARGDGDGVGCVACRRRAEHARR